MSLVWNAHLENCDGLPLKEVEFLALFPLPLRPFFLTYIEMAIVTPPDSRGDPPPARHAVGLGGTSFSAGLFYLDPLCGMPVQCILNNINTT